MGFRFVSFRSPSLFYLLVHSKCRGCLFSLDHTQTHTTVGRTPLDGGSARRRDLYLATQTLTRDKHPCPGGIRTHDPSKRSAADPRLRPRRHGGSAELGFTTCKGKALCEEYVCLSVCGLISSTKWSVRPSSKFPSNFCTKIIQQASGCKTSNAPSDSRTLLKSVTFSYFLNVPSDLNQTWYRRHS
jgi:hypothetical protein